jgi:hypothetical protein
MGVVRLFRVVLRLQGIKMVFNLPFFKIVYDPFIFAKIIFPKFELLTVRGMAFCVNLGLKCQNLFCLV